MNDGRILYNRWEYVDKGAGAVQSLWAMFPDGGQSEEIYGNNIGTPPVFNQAKQVPGRNNLVVCLGAGHCPGNVGAILLVDLHKDKRTPAAMTALTPDCVPKGNWGLRQFRNGRWIARHLRPVVLRSDAAVGRRGRPSAAAGKFFLVSCNPEGVWNDPAGYGIYLLDVFGNRVPVYGDPAISCFQPRPLEPRPVPPSAGRFRRRKHEGRKAARRPRCWWPTSTRGSTAWPAGTVKYLRVMEQVPRPWSVYRDYRPTMRRPARWWPISLLHAPERQGVARGRAGRGDGSACFTVPADRNIFLQALDGDFMEVQRMRTFVNFQPGERAVVRRLPRTPQPGAARPAPAAALAAAGQRPQPQPGDTGPRPIHYPTDVQPIFDRHCVSCHNAKKADGGLDLGGEMTGLFCRSYENIIDKDLVGYIQEFVGPKPEGADAMGYAPAVPPYTYGSHKSWLVTVIRKGHYGVKLPREDFIRLVTWVDANAPYYGSYFGRRNIAYRSQGDFRPVPTLESALGVPPPGGPRRRHRVVPPARSVSVRNPSAWREHAMTGRFRVIAACFGVGLGVFGLVGRAMGEPVGARPPALPFAVTVTPEKLEPSPDYMGPKNPVDMDFPYCPVMIDGEYWIIYKNGYSGPVLRFKGTNIENARPPGRRHGPVSPACSLHSRRRVVRCCRETALRPHAL